MISNNPKVSIFVITYNQEKFVQEAIVSCVKQDYENFEVVVSDDGSKDDTVKILLELKKLYPEKIKLILNPINQGITKNCNVALENCTGELIAFMGGDDVLYPNKISIQVKAFKENTRLVFCYHPCHVLRDGKIINTIGWRKKDLVKDFYEYIAKYGVDIPGPVPMVLREAIPEDGFNEALLVASDWLFFIDVCSKGDLIRINDILSAYRKHDNNIGLKIHSYANDFLRTIDIIKIKYPDNNVQKAADKAIRRFLLGIMYRCIADSELNFFNGYLAEYRKRNGNFSWFIRLLSEISFAPIVLNALRGSIKKIF
jgi:glycosyltransferase involved in cell wall biosynthesis